MDVGHSADGPPNFLNFDNQKRFLRTKLHACFRPFNQNWLEVAILIIYFVQWTAAFVTVIFFEMEFKVATHVLPIAFFSLAPRIYWIARSLQGCDVYNERLHRVTSVCEFVVFVIILVVFLVGESSVLPVKVLFCLLTVRMFGRMFLKFCAMFIRPFVLIILSLFGLGITPPKTLIEISKENIDKLAMEIYANVEGEETPTCAVCMSELENGEHLRTLPCQHQYHTECVDRWLLKKKTCPLCRSEIDSLMNVVAEEAGQNDQTIEIGAANIGEEVEMEVFMDSQAS